MEAGECLACLCDQNVTSLTPSGMIALRLGATALNHEHFVQGIAEVQSKKVKEFHYYA